MNIDTNILEEAVNAKHGGLQAIAEREGINYHTFRKAVSAYERQQADAEAQEWMNAPLGRPVAESAVSQARDTLRAVSNTRPRPDAADTWERARREALGEEVIHDQRTWSCDPYQDVPAPLVVIPVEPLHIANPNVLVMSDLHSPYTNDVMIKRALHITKTQFPGVRDVALMGDTFNAGAVSRHGKNNYDTDVPTERKHTGLVLRSIFRHFDRAWISLGNHDERCGMCQALVRQISTTFREQS